MTETETEPGNDLGRLPHRPPMRLITAVLARNQHAVLCRAVLPDDYPVASAGKAPPVLSVEIGAQASALLHEPPSAGDAEEAGATSRVGYLVSVRRVSFQCQSLPTGTPMLVLASSAGRAGPLQMVDFELIREIDQGENAETEFGPAELLILDQGLAKDVLLARGTLGTFQSQEPIDNEPQD